LLAFVAAGCTRLSFLLANAPAAFGSHRRVPDLAFGNDSRQSLDLYLPAQASALPVIVFWYGGSWTSGQKADYRFVGAALAKRGFVVAVADYRLHPSVGFPAFVEDGARAVAWLQRNVGAYGGDPQRIVLAGHSAGAYIAAFLALSDDALEDVGASPKSIRGFIGLAGPYAIEASSPTLRAIFAEPYAQADWQPIGFVEADAPPALLIHGDADKTVSPRQTLALRSAMEAAGVEVETEIYPGANHRDVLAAFATLAAGRAPVLEQSVRFARRVTGGAAPPR
jgi:acetyl esterase/lipase